MTIGTEIRIDLPGNFYVKGFIIEDVGNNWKIDVSSSQLKVIDKLRTLKTFDSKTNTLIYEKSLVRKALTLFYEYQYFSGKKTLKNMSYTENGYYMANGVKGYYFGRAQELGILQDQFILLTNGDPVVEEEYNGPDKTLSCKTIKYIK